MKFMCLLFFFRTRMSRMSSVDSLVSNTVWISLLHRDPPFQKSNARISACDDGHGFHLLVLRVIGMLLRTRYGQLVLSNPSTS